MGNTSFVDPALVEGTLREGFTRLAGLDTAWERAVYTGFLVAEVHPFVDCNGRMARVMMNAELVRGNQSKIIVTTGFRDDYLTSLRRPTRQRMLQSCTVVRSLDHASPSTMQFHERHMLSELTPLGRTGPDDCR